MGKTERRVDFEALIARLRTVAGGFGQVKHADIHLAADALERQQAVVEAARLDDMAADGVTVAMVEIKALRADLKAVAVAGQLVAEGKAVEVGTTLLRMKLLRKALDRPGVRAALLDAPPEGDG